MSVTPAVWGDHTVLKPLKPLKLVRVCVERDLRKRLLVHDARP